MTEILYIPYLYKSIVYGLNWQSSDKTAVKTCYLGSNTYFTKGGGVCNINFCFSLLHITDFLYILLLRQNRVYNATYMHAISFLCNFNLQHTLHYLRMHCAVAELHLTELAPCFLFSIGLVKAASLLRFHNCRHRLHYVNSIIQSVILICNMFICLYIYL